MTIVPRRSFPQRRAADSPQGPSGCGKTTLLDILAGRKNQGVIGGELLIGGQKPTRSFLRRYAGYVEQFDTLLGALTVHEMLSYTAELKLPPSVSKESKQQLVEDMIEELGLESCRNVRIGSEMSRGISGGQAKRVNIGVALVTQPKILFLVSYPDSQGAEAVAIAP